MISSVVDDGWPGGGEDIPHPRSDQGAGKKGTGLDVRNGASPRVSLFLLPTPPGTWGSCQMSTLHPWSSRKTAAHSQYIRALRTLCGRIRKSSTTTQAYSTTRYHDLLSRDSHTGHTTPFGIDDTGNAHSTYFCLHEAKTPRFKPRLWSASVDLLPFHRQPLSSRVSHGFSRRSQ